MAPGAATGYASTMTLAEILNELATSDSVPEAALMAAVPQADALAPHVYAVADKLCRGVHLLPRDNSLLFYGMPVLAAARHPDLYERVLALVRQPIESLDAVFPDHADVDLARLMLTAWDGDADRLFHMLEHADLAASSKTALFNVVSRLTFDGRIPRERTAEFMARIERDNLIDDGDMSWWGWELAAVELGLVELEPALHRAWTKEIYAQHTQADHDDSIQRMRRAAENPSDPTPFDEEDVRPIDDPVEAVSWVGKRARLLAEIVAAHAEDGAPGPVIGIEPDDVDFEDDDPAREIRLSEAEMMWLDGFLHSRQVPQTTMSLEMLDGFLTALTIGPKAVPVDTYWPQIWDSEDGSAPQWDGAAQELHVRALVMRHADAIKARSAARAEHRPEIDDFGMEEAATEWALGFIEGIELTGKAWDPIFKDRRADQVVLPIVALSGEAPDEVYQELDEEKRAEIVETLPVLLQMIDAYWRDPRRRLPGPEPMRAVKIGRNDPCPCGSGTKYKKCCGSGTNSTLH